MPKVNYASQDKNRIFYEVAKLSIVVHWIVKLYQLKTFN